ncbi:MAG TPA: protease complex subunit PrcB family protein [Syntrophomonadaceae bacterium]|nr:protease complex subunit PrcB family protein [Syntrophomonadaceae bacterium]
MRIRTTLFTVLIMVFLLVPMGDGVVQAEEAVFSDIQGHWAEAQITQAYQAGIMKGINENTFAPDAVLSRAQLAVLLQQTFDFPMGEAAGQASDFYSDVEDDQWYSQAVAIAGKYGLLAAGGAVFGPDQPVSRFETAMAIQKCMHLQGVVPPHVDRVIPLDLQNPGLDAEEKAAALYVYQTGIMKGYNHQFNGHDWLTRAEGAVLSNQITKLLQDKESSLLICTSKLPDKLSEWVQQQKYYPGLAATTYQGRDYYLLSMGARSTGGYSLTVQGCVQEEGIWKVDLVYKEPAPDAIVIMVITYPHQVFSVPAGQEIHFTIRDDKGTIIQTLNTLQDTSKGQNINR